MSELSHSASTAREQAKAYVASILKALGSRDAMEVLAETPATLPIWRATPAELKRVMHHAERGDEPLEQTIPTYAGHDLVHLAQIRRIREAIGAPAGG